MAASIFLPSEDTLVLDLLVLPDVSLLSLASTLEPLRAANRVAGEELYRWRLVSPDGKPIVTSSGLRIDVDAAFDSGTDAGALIVVAAFNVFRHATPELLRGLRAVARRRVAIGGVEAGAWVLALAGLLEGRKATTHWEDLEDFATRFPGIAVQPSRFVVDGDRFTTGGASPALDMMLDLIRIRQGYALALSVASVFIYDRAHGGEDPQPSVSLGRLDWYEPRVAGAIRAMEQRIDRPLPIAAIAKSIGISARTLEAQFSLHVGLSPRDFYGRMRLEAGRRMVLETRDDMSSVAGRCGFQSASAFTRAFRERYGSSPREARAARRNQ